MQKNVLAAIVRRNKAVSTFLVELQHPARSQLLPTSASEPCQRPTSFARLTQRDRYGILLPPWHDAELARRALDADLCPLQE
jgi:hypothetical protein